MGDCQARFREKGGWNSLHLLDKGKTMKMEKDHLNDKVLDKEKALSAIKTSYLNSYKVIVAGVRDFADYAFMKKKT